MNKIEFLFNQKLNNKLASFYQYALFLLFIGTVQMMFISSLEASTTYLSPILDNKENQTPLIKAIKAENTKEIKSLIDSGLDINESDSSGYTPLMAAIYKGNLKIIRLLINKGAILETCDYQGNTPFMYAFYGNHQKEDVVEFLLGLNVNIQVMNDQEHTPLILATLNNHCKSMELLLSAGAGIEAKGKSGKTALTHAADNQNLKSVQLLIRFGANLETREEWSFTPLMTAAFKNDGAMIRLLLKAGADLNARTTMVIPVSIKKDRFDFHPTIVSIPKDSSALDIAKQFEKRVAENALIQAGNTQ